MSSFGEDLRRERELRRITLREVAETTKINLRHLEALEQNDFGHLPGGVFNRGFVRAYAECIGVDPETMVNAYLAEEQSQRAERTGDAAPHELPARSRSRAARPRRRWLWLVVPAALLALAAWALWLWLGRAERAGPDATSVLADADRERLSAPDEAAAVVEQGAAAVAPSEEPVVAEPPPTGEPRGGGEEPEAPPRTAPTPPPATPERAPGDRAGEGPRAAATEPPPLVATVRVARRTFGSLNCDNRRVEMLDGLEPGTTLRFRCERFLIVNATDGGALSLSREGQAEAPLGADGVPLTQMRIDAPGADRGSEP